MKDRSLSRVFTLKFIGLGVFGLLLVVRIIVSLAWTMEHDSPLLYYTAFLMKEHGAVPYVDFFETSMPGTFLFHYAIAEWFGFGSLAFRFVDLGVLGVLLLITFVFMKRFGVAPAVGACIAFGLIFLSLGPWMSLQREYFALVPIAASLLTIPSCRPAGYWWLRFALTGFLFGSAAMIKPHLSLGLIPVLLALYMSRGSNHRWRRLETASCLLLTFLFFSLPAAVAILWIVTYRALDAFLSVFLEYLPLHTQLTKFHVLMSPGEYAVYLLKQSLEFGDYSVLILGALVAAYRFFGSTEGANADRWAARAIFLMCLAYVVYPSLSGQFWRYHYMPLAFFLSLAASLALLEDRNPVSAGANAISNRRLRSRVAAAAFFFALFIQANSLDETIVSIEYLRGGTATTSDAPASASGEAGRAREISSWLQQHRRPGDTVQPLDWVKGGGIHALLLARAPLGTRFLYNYHFYHHVSSPYIQQLRAEFVDQLKTREPRFVIEFDRRWSRIRGVDTSSEFRELEALLERDYEVVREGEGYSVLERIDPRGA